MYRVLVVVFIFALSLNAFAYEEPYVFNHSELDWYRIETEHFVVIYHNGSERTAKVVAKVAEDIYQPITDLYGYEPDDKVHFIIKDYDDVANGGAYYYDNMVEILAPQMTFTLRGTHNWLRNVVTHEFSHMVSLGASRKITRKIPSFYFQWIGFEREKRPDVLYGYPNQIASYAIPMTTVPMWLAEGMAQYQISGLDYDKWDTHRDMLIRTAVITNTMHTYAEMGVFGKNSLGNERTYNAGYAFTRYIAYNYGEQSLKTITDNLKKFTTFTVNGAIEKVTGTSDYALYGLWKSQMTNYYNKRLSVISKHKVEGVLVVPDGIGNISPAWSPDGNSIAYCGSKSSDYLSMTSLKVYDVSTGKSRTIKGSVNGGVTWSPDGKKLMYQKKDIAAHGSYFYDLYIYDMDTHKEKQLTHNLRSIDPAWSPDGKTVVCVAQKDGTDNLVLLNIDDQLDDTTTYAHLTEYKLGEGVYSPHFSPEGNSIVFAQARNHGRDVMIMDLATRQIKPVIAGVGDARDPVYSPDGQYIYFAWNKSGIHNIYRVNPDGTDPEPLTNVTGGAFMPSVSKAGKLAYSQFNADGYKIAVLQKPQPVPAEYLEYVDARDIAPELDNSSARDRYTDIRNYDDTLLEDYDSKPYKMEYKQMMFLPRVMIDSNKVKIGTYFTASDYLNKYNVLGGVVVNHRLDLDAFAIFEYHQLPPTLFLELYAFTRNIKRSIDVIEDYPDKAPVDIQFTILEADFGTRALLFKHFPVYLRYRHQRYTSKIKDFFFHDIKWVSPSNTYFVGNSLVMNMDLDMVAPGIHASINPDNGRKIALEYSYEVNDFFEDFATDNEYGTPQEVYTKYKYNRVQLNWHEYLPNPLFNNHALDVNLIGGWIDRPVDSFFNFFAGGLPGLRGYPFYSIEGRKMLVGRFTYRLPIFTRWQKQIFNITTQNLYVGGFVDYGNAFNGDSVEWSDFKRDAGMDVRFKGFSFFGFPTALEWSAAYSLDQFEHEGYTYGKEWRYYISLLFDFMD